MRWDSMRVPLEGESTAPDDALFARPAVVRTFDSPQFAGMTFYEVHAKSILNRVPAVSRVPFEWTINPYRGCSHACRYCFARNTHTYLDLGAGLDFDTKVVVKINAPDLLRRELARGSWRGQPVAMGTNVDCYQRAEGRYRLMPGIIRALTEHANPFSILTKGSLILRDLELLTAASRVTDASTAVSVGFVDQTLWREVEPGTPNPLKRLEVCRTLNDAGVRCGVLMAPILPGLTDSPDQLAATVTAIAAAGAVHVTPIVLHLRPGARDWFMGWLSAAHPDLVSKYRLLYGRSAYAPKSYQDDVCAQVRKLAKAAGIGKPTSNDRTPAERGHRQQTARPAALSEQLSLLA
ncbi:MAG TPA: Rv2578c family radical SAM protein [Acidothermaceae bacterium]|jgi:DNA repair photolyase